SFGQGTGIAALLARMRSVRCGAKHSAGDVSRPSIPDGSRSMRSMVEHEEQKTLESITAADVMTPAPLTCSTFSTVLEAVMIFRDANCGAVPILEEGRPVA